MSKLKTLILAIILLLVTVSPASAYTNNMSASVVVGQANFTSSSPNQNGTASINTLSSPRGIIVCNGKLIVADSANNRVLIYNTIPTSNNVSADVVVGQQDFSSSAINQTGSTTVGGANTLWSPSGVTCSGSKLIIGDTGNSRVLIFNSIPTSNNDSANVVIGQQDFTTVSINQGGSCDANTLNKGTDKGVTTDGQHLIIADQGNHRVLIYNSIPTSNNASADSVVGQADFTHCSINRGGSADVNTLSNPRHVFTDGQGLYIADFGNQRVLIYNSIPTINGSNANVVIGQRDFTSTSSNQGGSTGPNTTASARGVFISQNRLFLAENSNNRIIIFNAIPTSNNASADIVIGQANLTSGSANQGGSSPGANTLTSAYAPVIVDNQLIVSDLGNNRLLIFDNVINSPLLSLGTSQGRENGIVRLSGNANVSSTYNVKSVEYTVNGGGTSGAVASDGIFDEASEDFYFDFDPKSNGNNSPGFVVKVKATNTNMDTTDNFLYFTPFSINSPANNSFLTSGYPTFDFSVNTQRDAMKNSMSKYQIQIKPTGASSWTTLIDDINPDYDNGTLETDKYIATYSDNSSRISVKSKVNSISGSVSWKVVAVDKSGHGQETENRTLSSSATASHFLGSYFFPLVLTKVSSNKLNYQGIAFANSQITLNLTDTKTNLVKTYITTANSSSKFNLNIPWQDIKTGKKYQVDLSATKDDKYNQLPTSIFTLSSSAPKVQGTQTEVAVPTLEPTPIPTLVPVTPTPLITPKRCFLFFCR